METSMIIFANMAQHTLAENSQALVMMKRKLEGGQVLSSACTSIQFCRFWVICYKFIFLHHCSLRFGLFARCAACKLRDIKESSFEKGTYKGNKNRASYTLLKYLGLTIF